MTILGKMDDKMKVERIEIYTPNLMNTPKLLNGTGDTLKQKFEEEGFYEGNYHSKVKDSYVKIGFHYNTDTMNTSFGKTPFVQMKEGNLDKVIKDIEQGRRVVNDNDFKKYKRLQEYKQNITHAIDSNILKDIENNYDIFEELNRMTTEKSHRDYILIGKDGENSYLFFDLFEVAGQKSVFNDLSVFSNVNKDFLTEEYKFLHDTANNSGSTNLFSREWDAEHYIKGNSPSDAAGKALSVYKIEDKIKNP